MSVLSVIVTTAAQAPAFGIAIPRHREIDTLHRQISIQHLSLADSSHEAFSPQDKQAVLSLLDTMRTSAGALTDNVDRLYVLSELAIAYATWDDRETAIALVEEAYALSQTPGEDWPAWELTMTAQAAAMVGRSEYAKVSLNAALARVDEDIQAILNNDEAVDRDFVVWDLQQMVNATAQMEDRQTAEQMLGSVLERLAEPLEAVSQQRVLEAVVESIVEAVEPWEEDATTRVFLGVHQTIESIGQSLNVDADDLLRSLVVDDLKDLQVAIASTAASFNDDTQATVLLRALQTSEAITEPVAKAEVLIAIALAYDELGHSQKATAALAEAIRLEQETSDDWQRLQILSQSITVADKLGDRSRRDNLFRQALDVTQALSENDERSASSVQQLATVAAEYADSQQAIAALQSLVPVAAKISWEGTRAGAFEYIVRASGSLAHEADTVQILNAIIPFIDSLTEDFSRERLTSEIVAIATTLAPQDMGTILQQMVQRNRKPEWISSPSAWEETPEWNANGWTDSTGWIATIRSVVRDLESRQDPMAVLQVLRTTAQTFPDAGAQATGLLLVAQGYESQNRLEEMVAVIQEVMELLEGLPDDHAVKPQSMGLILAMASGVNDVSVVNPIMDDVITYGTALMPDDHKTQFIQAVASGLPKRPHLQFTSRADTLVSIGQTIQSPDAQVGTLMAIATIYTHLDTTPQGAAVDPTHNQTVIDILDQALALVSEATDDFRQQAYQQLAIAQQYANSGNQAQAEAILDQFYHSNPEDVQVEEVFSLFQMLRGAVAMDSMDRAIAAMEPLITVADTLSREAVRRTMDEKDAAALEWEYQTSDPEEQLERLWNESKTSIFIGMARFIVEEMAGPEAKPQLAPTLEAAIAATDSITRADDRFYALRAMGIAALHTHNTDQVIAAFTQAMSTFDGLDQVYDPMASLIEPLEEYDLTTSADILAQIVEGMEPQTVTDEIKVSVVWAIVHYLTHLDEPTVVLEE